MDRISDSGSDGCGSIPHGGTYSTIVTKFSPILSRWYCFYAILNCAPKVGHNVKLYGKSKLCSKNSSCVDATVRKRHQCYLS